MISTNTIISNISDTAFWVAYYRFIESKKKDALFNDPFAELLIGEHGKRVSDSMRRFGKYAYWSVTIRTPLIDEYIMRYINQGYKAVINLGAGLDTRPYRLSLPSDLQWIEIDFEEIITLKNDKLKKEEPKCKLQRIELDLSNQAERKRLFCELNHSAGPAIILTEGVIPYLDENAVISLANDLKAQANFKLWITDYYSPEVYPRYQSPKFRDSLGNSPFMFFPVDWFSLFSDCGWVKKEMQYLYDEAAKHNRKFPLPWWVSFLKYFIGEQRITERVRKYSAYIVFEKNGMD